MRNYKRNKNTMKNMSNINEIHNKKKLIKLQFLFMVPYMYRSNLHTAKHY